MQAMRDFMPDDVNVYMEWQDKKPAQSVVYVSFGSILSVSKRQQKEMRRGLEATDRPYLWVARKSSNGGGVTLHGGGVKLQGMVVDWCNQVRVLSHPTVGCFVMRCRWDSTLESITGSVTMVSVPRWADQPTVAAMVKASVGVGVRVRVDGEGVGERCAKMVMGGTHGAAVVMARAELWGQRAKEAVSRGGTLDGLLRWDVGLSEGNL